MKHPVSPNRNSLPESASPKRKSRSSKTALRSRRKQIFGRLLFTSRSPIQIFFLKGAPRAAAAPFYRKAAGLPHKLLNQVEAKMNLCRLSIENANQRAVPTVLPFLPPATGIPGRARQRCSASECAGRMFQPISLAYATTSMYQANWKSLVKSLPNNRANIASASTA